MYVCVHWKTKVYTAVSVCSLAKRICMCKAISTSMQNLKHKIVTNIINFNMAMNVVLLVVYSPCCLLSLSVRGEMSEAVQVRKSESCQAEREREREREREISKA